MTTFHDRRRTPRKTRAAVFWVTCVVFMALNVYSLVRWALA